MWYKLLTDLGWDTLALATPRAIATRKLEAYQKPILQHLIKIFLYPHLQNEIKTWEGEIANRWLIPAISLEINAKPIKLKWVQESLLPDLRMDNTKRKFNILIDYLTEKAKEPFPHPKPYSVDEFIRKYRVFRSYVFKAIEQNTLYSREDVLLLIEKHFIEV